MGYLNWFFALIYTDGAIFSWRLEEKALLLTWLVMSIVVVLTIYLESGIVDSFKMLVEKFFPESFWNSYLELKQKIQDRNDLSVSEKIGKRISRIEKHKYSLIFFLNLIPCIPYVRGGTIIAARILRLRFGIRLIIIGNLIKTSFLVLAVYTFLSVR